MLNSCPRRDLLDSPSSLPPRTASYFFSLLFVIIIEVLVKLFVVLKCHKVDRPPKNPTDAAEPTAKL